MYLLGLADAVDSCKGLALPTLVPPVVKNDGAVGSGQVQAMSATGDGDELQNCVTNSSGLGQKPIMAAWVGTHHDLDIRNLLEGLDAHPLLGWVHFSPEINELESAQKEQPPQEREHWDPLNKDCRSG